LIYKLQYQSKIKSHQVVNAGHAPINHHLYTVKKHIYCYRSIEQNS